MDKKPTDASTTVVGPSGTVYKTRGSRDRYEDGQGLLVQLTGDRPEASALTLSFATE